MKTWSEQGEAAFPVTVDTELVEYGMSLRDYFAGQALVPFMTVKLNCPIEKQHNTPQLAAEYYAKAAYCVADAMIKARSE